MLDFQNFLSVFVEFISGLAPIAFLVSFTAFSFRTIVKLATGGFKL